MPADTDRAPLPFEPTRKQKKSQQSQQSQPPQKAKSPTTPAKADTQAPQRSPKRPKYTQEETSIPEAVSRRMLRRMVFFSGIPVVLGILVFFSSYVMITQGIANLPNIAVLLTTLACFGLSVVGLTYGALSASWEEETVGSMIGFDQFQLNGGRLLNSWREARENRQNNS